MTEQYKSSEVTFKYYLPDNQNELWMHSHGPDMYYLLYEIDNKLRGILKYEERGSQDKFDLCEEIREMIHKNIDLDKVN